MRRCRCRPGLPDQGLADHRQELHQVRHGTEKQKAKLRLDSREGWLKGGEDGKIVVPGDPDHSDVVLAIKYQAKDEDDNMPPKKKTRLTADQVDIIVQWIKAGMPWPAQK